MWDPDDEYYDEALEVGFDCCVHGLGFDEQCDDCDDDIDDEDYCE